MVSLTEVRRPLLAGCRGSTGEVVLGGHWGHCGDASRDQRPRRDHWRVVQLQGYPLHGVRVLKGPVYGHGDSLNCWDSPRADQKVPRTTRVAVAYLPLALGPHLQSCISSPYYPFLFFSPLPSLFPPPPDLLDKAGGRFGTMPIAHLRSSIQHSIFGSGGMRRPWYRASGKSSGGSPAAAKRGISSGNSDG